MYNTGIDVSEHNGVMDWDEIRRAGISFVIIRLGEAATTISNFSFLIPHSSKDFTRNQRAARPRG